MITTTYSKAPAITPLVGVLLDAATVEDGIENLPVDGIFDSFNCITTDRRATWQCPQVYLAAPVQTASSTSGTGGTIAAGTYRFKITAVNAQGETIPSNEISQVTTGTTSRIILNWNAVTGATAYRIYATAGATNTEKLLTTVGNVVTYNWTGAPAIGTANPPTANTAESIFTKDFTDRPTYVDGQRFTVYAGIGCKPFDFSLEKAHEEAGRVFAARESYGVERAVIETVLQGATDLTPAGGAVDPVVGLALLEADASTKYAGVPTIHVPRGIGSLLMSKYAINPEGAVYYSRQGSKVASGGGYEASNMSPAAVVPAAGERWIYGSGNVLVRRSALIQREEMDRNTNEVIGLVERTYIVAVDCYRSAVRVKVA